MNDNSKVKIFHGEQKKPHKNVGLDTTTIHLD
jgi:hypothetical protein